MMNTYIDNGPIDLKHFSASVAGGAAIIAVFVLLALYNPGVLERSAFEFGWIEIGTGWCFGAASVLFFLAARKSEYLKTLHRSRYVFFLGWALLMFIFMGEESSWGQWLFGFEPPESIKAVNTQDELNLHNLWFMQKYSWNTYRFISVFMLGTGLLLPIFAFIPVLRKMAQRWAFPILPAGYSILFVGSYAFGKYFHFRMAGDTGAEVRELLLGIAMLVFALHAFVKPEDLLRLRQAGDESD